jgi:hypothetical protein
VDSRYISSFADEVVLIKEAVSLPWVMTKSLRGAATRMDRKYPKWLFTEARRAGALGEKTVKKLAPKEVLARERRAMKRSALESFKEMSGVPPFKKKATAIKQLAQAVPRAKGWRRPLEVLKGTRIDPLKEQARRASKRGWSPHQRPLEEAAGAEARRETAKTIAARSTLVGAPIAGLAAMEARR